MLAARYRCYGTGTYRLHDGEPHAHMRIGTRSLLLSRVCNKKKLTDHGDAASPTPRRANALGNSQGQVTRLCELCARTCNYVVSHWYTCRRYISLVLSGFCVEFLTFNIVSLSRKILFLMAKRIVVKT